MQYINKGKQMFRPTLGPTQVCGSLNPLIQMSSFVANLQTPVKVKRHKFNFKKITCGRFWMILEGCLTWMVHS